MTPLQVTAHLGGPVSFPGGAPALDSLLMWAQAQVDGLPPPACASDCSDVPIPVAKSDGGEVYLASFGKLEVEKSQHRWVNRRFPLAEAQLMGDKKLRRVQLNGGPCKSYRIPLEQTWIVDDRVDWWCIGEADPIRELLGWVGYLGKRRAVGNGRVVRWEVVDCDPWGPGFPVVRNGKPMRPLPPDWPRLIDPHLGYATLLPPYWDRTREEPCAIPM